MVGLLRCLLWGCKEQGAYVFVGTSSTGKESWCTFFLGTTGLDVPIMLFLKSQKRRKVKRLVCVGLFVELKLCEPLIFQENLVTWAFKNEICFTVGSYIL